MITSVDVDKHTGRTFWTALYSDDETGDLWDNELIAYGIDYVDGRMPGHVAMKTSHPRASIDEGTESNDELSPQTPEDYEGGILINPVVMKESLQEYDGYYTVAGDTFKDVSTKLSERSERPSSWLQIGGQRSSPSRCWRV